MICLEPSPSAVDDPLEILGVILLRRLSDSELFLRWTGLSILLTLPRVLMLTPRMLGLERERLLDRRDPLACCITRPELSDTTSSPILLLVLEFTEFMLDRRGVKTMRRGDPCAVDSGVIVRNNTTRLILVL